MPNSPVQAPEEIQPVRKSIVVKAPVEIAFRVFTSEITTWWDLQNYHIGQSSPVSAEIEPRVGGRWFERGDDGSECDWGRVLVWDPPARLVLTWQISSTWQFDATIHTEVEIRFISTGASATRVELEHRLLTSYKEAASQMHGIFDSAQGWSHILDAFVRSAESY